jgi:hypothetical protein
MTSRTNQQEPNPNLSLTETDPDLAAQWHRQKNGGVTPEQITRGSKKRPWWKCPEGPDHEWQAAVYSRANAGLGCPCCSGYKACITNSLSSLFPEIAQQLHPDLNNGVTADQIIAGSHSQYWWKCPEGPDHEWQAPVRNRAKLGQGCPSCSGRKLSVSNSLSTLFPEIAQELHLGKNKGVTADQILAGTSTKYWWACSRVPDHTWEAPVVRRTSTGWGCPFCANQKVSATNSLSVLFPDVAKEWHPTLNNGVTPEQVIAGSHKQYWWTCPEGPDHEWQASVKNRTFNDTGCRFCHGKQASVTNSLASLYPSVAIQLDPEKNNGVTAEQVVAASATKYWWRCPEGPDHEWENQARHRTERDQGCPCCRGYKLSITNSLSSLFPDVAQQLHPYKNNGATADQILSGTHSRYWWKCPEGPDHEWRATVDSRTSAGVGCPCCSGHKVSVTNSLPSLFPDLAKELHPEKNHGVRVESIVAGTPKNYWWKCPKGPDHEWSAQVRNRAYAGHNCPYCNILPRSKQEIELAFELRLFFDFDLDDHKELVDGKLLDCDIIIRQHGLIIEFDGFYWHQSKGQSDLAKTNALLNKGWNVIRVREEPLQLISPIDVSVPITSNMKPAADVVLVNIQKILGEPLEGLNDYLALTTTKNNKASRTYIREALKPPN